MDKPGISAAARRLIEEDARLWSLRRARGDPSPRTSDMSRPTPPELLGEQGAADAIVSGVVD